MNRTDMPGYEPISLGFMLKEEDAAPLEADERKSEQFRKDLMAKQRLMEAMDMKVETMLRRDEPMPTHSAALEILKGRA